MSEKDQNDLFAGMTYDNKSEKSWKETNPSDSIQNSIQTMEWRQTKFEEMIRGELSRLSHILEGSMIIDTCCISNFNEDTKLPEDFIDISKKYGHGYSIVANKSLESEFWHISYCVAKKDDSAQWAPRFSCYLKFLKRGMGNTEYCIFAFVNDCSIYEAKEIVYTVCNLDTSVNRDDPNCLRLKENVEFMFREYEPASEFKFFQTNVYGPKKKFVFNSVDDLVNFKAMINGIGYTCSKVVNTSESDICFLFHKDN